MDPLPPQWEWAWAADQGRYYLQHQDSRTTHWVLPEAARTVRVRTGRVEVAVPWWTPVALLVVQCGRLEAAQGERGGRGCVWERAAASKGAGGGQGNMGDGEVRGTTKKKEN